MKKIANTSALIFIGAVAVLSLVSLLGIWSFLDENVIQKSVLSIGLLAVIALVIMVADNFIEESESTGNLPVFSTIRQKTLQVLVGSVGLLAFVGVLGIWEVLSGDVFEKTLATIFTLAFSSFIIVLVCLDRVKSKNPKRTGMSGKNIILLFILVWILSGVVSFMF